ncbi:MAG: Mur ligase domain-containing protein, partial [Rhodospirillales bacterium]|nr:Mur ligase domain-containing protein [Rhodospirillales bacterium]
MGCHVSGADQMASPAVDRLRQDGFEVYSAHRAEQVNGADLVVYSAAVPENNAELRTARRLGIVVVKRAVLLGELTRSRFAVAVAGSHGKTTTAAMLAAICRRAGLEPGTAVGGCVQGRVEAGWGKGDIFVVEADEYDRSFHQLHPRLALVTGIDAEHLDCYRDLADVQRAFAHYLDRLPFYGQGVLAGDDDGVQTLL